MPAETESVKVGFGQAYEHGGHCDRALLYLETVLMYRYNNVCFGWHTYALRFARGPAALRHVENRTKPCLSRNTGIIMPPDPAVIMLMS